MTEWTGADSEQALGEGWDIFDSEGSDNGPWTIQRLDDPYHLPYLGFTKPVFGSDPDAWIHVVALARGGSPLHQKALAFIRENNSLEAEAIDDWTYNNMVSKNGIGAAIKGDNPLFRFLNGLAGAYRLGEFDEQPHDGWLFESREFGTHELKILTDEDGDEYLFVGFALPDDTYVETDYDTYGMLYGFRIYREEA